MDWIAWHAGYDEPGSLLDRRLGYVQARVREAFDTAPSGPNRVISI